MTFKNTTKKPFLIWKRLIIIPEYEIYFANFLYLFMNLSTLPAVSTSLSFPV